MPPLTSFHTHLKFTKHYLIPSSQAEVRSLWVVFSFQRTFERNSEDLEFKKHGLEKKFRH